ncbi:autotransporter assembly complex family protein [Alkalilimnicola ehrlichii]|uniref:autotransporter assembly complex protein TamA n=1 Tax=Alkalilimnicola ehrlichii TaxID=351052 RepID=UPI002161904C|nr:POTRA domain-containing protein [Alkalilimnicola ehrlichii]
MRTALFRVIKICLLSGFALLAQPLDAAVRLVIEGVSGALEDNVRAHVRQPPTANGAALRVFQRQTEQDARRAVQALGYYNAEIRVSRDTENGEELIRVHIDPGPRVQVTRIDIRFTGDAADDEAFRQLPQRLAIREGRGLHHGEYEGAKRAILNLALRRGYFDGRYLEQRIEVDRVDNEAAIILHYDSGPRYSLGEVFFDDTPFTDNLLERMVPFEPGTPYEASLVARFNRNLTESRYFDDVRVLPQQELAENYRIPISVELSERPPINLVSVSAFRPIPAPERD